MSDDDKIRIEGRLTDDELVELFSLLRRFDEVDPVRAIMVYGESRKRTTAEMQRILERAWPRVPGRASEMRVVGRR